MTNNPLIKNNSIHNALIEKIKKNKNLNDTFNNNINNNNNSNSKNNINNSHQLLNNYLIINDNNNNIEEKKKNIINEKNSNLNLTNIENSIKPKEKEEKEKNEIIETTSMQSTIRDNIFYRKEMEKISNYIKQCKIKIIIFQIIINMKNILKHN